ncbi:6898_t:CDS:1, partial [Funneliformis geosporum]
VYQDKALILYCGNMPGHGLDYWVENRWYYFTLVVIYGNKITREA